MVLFKHFEVELLKIGKVLEHVTKAAGKIYPKAKIYLNDDSRVNKRYELYNIGAVKIEEVYSTIEGHGLLIFIPKKPRSKEKVGEGEL